MKTNMNVKKLALIGMLGALGAILMLWRFPLPMLPPFMSFDFSGIPELIGGFALGPVSAILIVIVKILIQLVISGTNSMFTGELQGLLLSSAFVLPAAWIYQHNKTIKGALIGMLAGSILCSLVAVITNLYLIIPFYVSLYGMTMEQIVDMCSAVNANMNSVATMAIFGIIPFNLIKCGINCLITFLVYKKISPLIHHFAQDDSHL